MTVFSYSFLDVVAAITGPGGAFSIGNGSGNAEEGISFAFADDKDTMTMGADGTGMHSLHASNAGAVTVRVLKTSDTNKMLSDLYAYQKTSSANWGQNTITCNNVANGDAWTCQFGAFRKFPDVKYSKDGDVLEWAFNCTVMHGMLGNGQPAL